MKTTLFPFSLFVLSLLLPPISVDAQHVAVTDSVSVYANEEVEINVLANDLYNHSNSVRSQTISSLNSAFPAAFFISLDGTTSIKPFISASGIDTLYYLLKDNTALLYDTGLVIVNILPVRNAAYLDINATKALVNSNGCLFWDLENYAQFQVPADSSTSTVFSLTLIAAGKDAQDSNYLMVDPYNQTCAVYAGPLDTTDGLNDSLTVFQWNRVWKLSATEITEFRNHWWETGYVIPEAIQNWPAHGDVSKGHPSYLAPFNDIDMDGVYNPLAGDYPFIKGDQAILFICNNPVSGTEADYKTTGLQAIGMVYAYECLTDSLFNTSVFLDYTVINSSVNKYDVAYLGMYADFDIGYSSDDYMGTFVDLSTVYAYNGDTLDEDDNYIQGYGDYPPAQGLTLLKGPLADTGDGIDNDFDNTTDEPDETCGMYSSMIISNSGAGPGTFYIEKDYFYSLFGYYNDSVPAKWGLTYPSDTSSATPCRYMFPGTSDPNWLGTNGVPQTPAVWSEYLQLTDPYDRRGIMGFNSFTFNKNDRKSFSVALVYAQKDGLPYHQVPDLLHARIETLLDYYAADSIPCGGSFSGIAQTAPVVDFNIYPNPSSDMVTIDFSQQTIEGNNASINIFNLNGQCVMTHPCNGQQTSFSVSGLREGVYIVKFSNSKINESKRLVIVR